MTTMFIQLRRVVYLLVLLQCCAFVVSAAEPQQLSEGEKNAGIVRRWLSDVEVYYPKAKACETVWGNHTKKFEAQVKRAAEIATEMRNISNMTKVLWKEFNEEKNDGNKKKIAGRFRQHVEGAQVTVEKSKTIVTEARTTLEEARKMVDCTAPMGNLNDLITGSNEMRREYHTGLLEEENNKNYSADWASIIKTSKEKKEELVGLVDKLNAIKVRSRGYSREVAKNLEDVITSLEATRRYLWKARGAVNKMDSEFNPQMNAFEGAATTVEIQGPLTEVAAKVHENSIAPKTEGPGWGVKAGERGMASTGGGAVIRVYPEPVDKSKISKIVESFEHEEKKETKIMEDKKNAEEQRVIEEKKQAEIRRREEEVRAEKEREKLADEERARKAEEKAILEREKKAKEEKARREMAEAEKLAREESGRKAREEAVLAKKAKKNDGSSNPALVHRTLLLLLLCVLGCTLVC